MGDLAIKKIWIHGHPIYIKHHMKPRPSLRDVDLSTIEVNGENLCDDYLEGSDRNRTDDDGYFLQNTSDPHEDPAYALNYNCHSYTFSKHPMLKDYFTHHVWIDGRPNLETAWTNPTKTMFERFYTRKFVSERSSLNIRRIRDRLSPDDVVVLRSGNDFMHSGIVTEDLCRGELLIASKLGKGPLVAMPFENLIRLYNAWATIEVYQVKQTL